MKVMKKSVWFLVPVILLSLILIGSNDQKQKPVNMIAPQFVSAFPEPVEVQQPDGTPLTIMLSGDEFNHYVKTTDGFTLIQDEKGFYRYAEINEEGNLVMSNIQAGNPENRGRNERLFLRTIQPGLRYSEAQVKEGQRLRSGEQDASAEFAGLSGTFPSTGTRKLLVILVNFTNKSFVKTNADFNALYNTNTLSFKNYYLATSYNLLTVNTTVVGPYTLSGTMATYGANDASGYDINPRLMVQEAIDKAEAAGVNFAEYDNDGNGYVDGIQVVHAGYGEEAGAPAETIWSHRWTMSTYARTYDGVTINDYSTVPELYGTSGSTITGVGVVAHEFGHNLGCPDTYDTSGSGAWDCKKWDVMAGGSWNNNGNNPPLHNPYTRWNLSWLTPTTVTATTNLTLNAATSSTTVYKYDTTTANEYFLLENRQQTGNWDYYLPGHGMLIWHIDGNWIASHSSNNINIDNSHQGIDVEEADNVRSSTTYAADPFPGTGAKTSFTDTTTPNAKSWAGANTNKPITAIVESSGIITCTLTVSTTPSYCASKSNSYADEYIKSVKFGSITKTSTGSYYSDFTSTVFSMTRGTSVSFTLTPGFTGSTYTEYWKVWIDYNKDSDFADTGEQIYAGSGTTAKTSSFTVSSSASTGNTRMRVSMKYGSTPSYCETFSYGEVEDYTANIL